MNLSFPTFFAITLPLAGAPSAFAVDFETEIKPILRSKCGKCHTGPKAKGKLRYDNNLYFKKRIGEDEDAVVVPGKPLESLLIKKATLSRSDTDAMPPPRRGDPLTGHEVGLIKQWIIEGASLERGEGAAPVPATTTTDEPAAFDPKKLYTWNSTAGTSLEAAFVKLDDKTVVLRKEDGSELSVSMSQLAPDSRKQANDFAAAQ